MVNLQIMTLNIGNPSIDRARRQVAWLEERSEDVFVLSETKKSAGCNYIEEYFTQYGFDLLTMGSEKRYFVYFPKSRTDDLGVMVISKIPIQNTYTIFSEDHIYRTRFAGCDLVYNNKHLRIIGIYVPSRDGSEKKITRKKGFCVDTAKHIKTLENLSTVICGDFNIIDRGHKPSYTTFLDWEYSFYDFFGKEGYLDAFKHCYPDKQEYSWVGRTDGGYRYDYFFVSEMLKHNIADCSYLHETRTESLTDHSAVILKLS